MMVEMIDPKEWYREAAKSLPRNPDGTSDRHMNWACAPDETVSMWAARMKWQAKLPDETEEAYDQRAQNSTDAFRAGVAAQVAMAAAYLDKD